MLCFGGLSIALELPLRQCATPLDHHRRWATLLMTDLGTACCNRSGWLVTFDQKVRYIKGYYADFKRRMAKEEAKAAMEEAASWAASATARSRS